MHEGGKVREPGKVRSYAHAAFRTAMMAATDPNIPVAFEAFNVTAKPLATIRATRHAGARCRCSTTPTTACPRSRARKFGPNPA